MNRLFPALLLPLWLCAWCGLVPLAAVGASTNGLPSVEQVIGLMVARGAVLKLDTNSCELSVVLQVDELEKDGGIRKRTQKDYRAVQQFGVTLRTLTAVDGKPVARPSQDQASRKDEEHRQKAQGKAAASGKGGDRFALTKELAARFDFKVESQELVNNRPCWVLSFKPKAGDLPVKTMADRVINRLDGLIWVDATDNELAQARIRLREKISILGGV
ncbi:MAG TPA: hypothetical protein VK968_17025, partial [Roseimicrobium sp.]|nr:hypothetical protein [Roseimicrobium sp.]